MEWLARIMDRRVERPFMAVPSSSVDFFAVKSHISLRPFEGCPGGRVLLRDGASR